MYYICNRLIPSLEYLGSIYNGLLTKNLRFYSTFFYNNYVNVLKCRNSKINCTCNRKYNIRRIHTLNNFNSDDSSTSSSLNSKNNDSFTQLCEANDPEKQLYGLKNTRNQLDDIDKVLAMIKTGNIRDIDEYMFELIDKNILTNLDKFNISEINNLLHLSLKSFYSQNLIEALILKLKSIHPSDVPVSTLALVFQSLGRVLPCDFHLDRLEDFLSQTCDHLLKVDNLTESHFSSIIYGFQRLHYSNHDFLKKIVRRYDNNLANVNINSMTISLSSLVKLNYYDMDMILNIYKAINKSMSHMNLQTSIQLSTTICKIHEHYFTDGPLNHIKTNENESKNDIKTKDKLYKFNYKLLNTMLKNVCDQHLKDLTLFQICLLLDSINKMNYRKTTYISKLIQCIPSYNTNIVGINNNQSGLTSMENKDLVNLYIRDESSNMDENMDSMANAESNLSASTLSAKTSRNKNLYSYMEMPECPFNYNLTLKKLQNLDPSHLILISHSIFGLDYYNEYTLNLLLVIKDIINPILHELKAKHILLYTLSYINIYFTNYQLQRFNIRNEKKSVNRGYIELLLKLLENDNYRHNWFNDENLIKASTDPEDANHQDDDDKLLEEVKDIINRCEWKEELILSSFENLLRHSNFLKSSYSMMNLFKLLFSSLIYNVYIPNHPYYFNFDALSVSDGNEEQSIPDENDKTNIEVSSGNVGLERITSDGVMGVNRVPAIIPENILEKLYELYTSPTNSSTTSDNIKDDEEALDSNLNDNGELEVDDKVETDLQEQEQIIRLNNKCLYIDKKILCFKVDAVLYNF